MLLVGDTMYEGQEITDGNSIWKVKNISPSSLSGGRIKLSDYALINHNHDSEYASINHNHDTSYSAINHNHDTSYSAINHNHDTIYSNINHNHDLSYAAISHGNHVPTTETANNAKFLRNDNTWQTVTPANIGAATSSHNHDTAYSALNHNHNGVYEIINNGGIYIDTNTDFNNLTNPGVYYSTGGDGGSTIHASMSNSPTNGSGGGFKLIVSINGGAYDSGTYIRQIVYMKNGSIYSRTRNSSGYWYAWKSLIDASGSSGPDNVPGGRIWIE